MRAKMPKNPSKTSCSNGNPPGMNISTGGDAFLPPICVNKLDSGDNASEEDEVDDGASMPAPSEVPRKLRRTKHKHHHQLHPHHHNRHTNKSSMSDSFVLPHIGLGGSPPEGGVKRDPGWRENRAATHPDRKNDRRHGGIPISKSCPILGRHRYNAVDYDDDFESDDEDSDADTDYKSVSFNVGAASKLTRSRLKDKHFNVGDHQDEMTSGVLCKLAKLESPRRVDSLDQLLLHNSSSNNSNNTTSSSGTKLPNIFKTKSDKDGKDVEHIAKKSLLEKYENASTNKQLDIDARTRTKPTAKRLPESPRLIDSRASSWKIGASSSSTSSEASTNSVTSSSSTTLVPSPRLLRTQGTDLQQNDFPSETSVPRGSKTRRKYKKRHEKLVDSSKHLDTDADAELSETSTSDNKCRQWLTESDDNGTLHSTMKETQEEVVK